MEEALNKIQEFCKSHIDCMDCPLFLPDESEVECMLGEAPIGWDVKHRRKEILLMDGIIKEDHNSIVTSIIDIDISDLPSDKEYTYKGIINDPSEIPKDASEYDVYVIKSGEYSYVRASDLLIYRFKDLINIIKEDHNSITTSIIDINISDLPSDKEYTYQSIINDLSEIPKDASIYDLYIFNDDRFIYARKDINTYYRVMNTPLLNINRTSDSPSDREAKFDQGKPQLTLVPRQIIFDIARVREYGVAKYKDPENWKRVSVERYRDAAFRHFMAYLDDPYGVDEESGLPHISHLACNIAFLCELQKRKEK